MELIRQTMSYFKVIYAYFYLYQEKRICCGDTTLQKISGKILHASISNASKLHNPHLLVNVNHLFLVAFQFPLHNSNEIPQVLDVSELKIYNKARQILFEMTKEEITRVIDLKSNIGSYGHYLNISVVGFDNSLLFMSHLTGILATFDLVICPQKHNLPPNPNPKMNLSLVRLGK